MSNNFTPSRLRREGRNAFYPGGDPVESNPYLKKSNWSAPYNAKDWHEGWDQAKREYVAPEPTKPTLLELLREDFTDHEINTMPRVALIEAIERLMA